MITSESEAIRRRSAIIPDAEAASSPDVGSSEASNRGLGTKRGGRGGGGGTSLRLALVDWDLPTHPCQQGAPFPPHRETPPAHGCSIQLLF